MKYQRLFCCALLAGPGTAAAQLADGVYQPARHPAFVTEHFRFSGHQFVYLESTDVGAYSGRGTYKVQADTLWLYFKTPSPYRVGAPVDSGDIYRYRITKIRKTHFLLQGVMQGKLLGAAPQKYHRQRGKSRLEGEQ